MDCEPNMKEIPPSLASATAIVSFDTACITAETSGIFARIDGCSPILYLTTGVDKSTFSGVQSLLVKPGIKRYSLNVLDGSSINCAMLESPLYLYIKHSRLMLT